MRLLIFLFIFFILSIKGFSQKAIIANDSLEDFILTGSSIMILEDKKHEWTIDDITSKEIQEKFVLNKKVYAYNENTSSTYWIKFKVKRDHNSEKHFIFEAHAPHTEDFRLYVPRVNGKGYALKQS